MLTIVPVCALTLLTFTVLFAVYNSLVLAIDIYHSTTFQRLAASSATLIPLLHPTDTSAYSFIERAAQIGSASDLPLPLQPSFIMSVFDDNFFGDEGNNDDLYGPSIRMGNKLYRGNPGATLSLNGSTVTSSDGHVEITDATDNGASFWSSGNRGTSSRGSTVKTPGMSRTTRDVDGREGSEAEGKKD